MNFTDRITNRNSQGIAQSGLLEGFDQKDFILLVNMLIENLSNQ